MFTVILYVDHVNTQNCSSIQTEMHVYPFIYLDFCERCLSKSICSKVTLAKRGLKVTVLEKRSILGGRARSWIDGVTRDPVHIGPHVVVSEYPNFFKLLDQLGTLQKILFSEQHFLIFFVRGSIWCCSYGSMFVSFCLFVCLCLSAWS